MEVVSLRTRPRPIDSSWRVAQRWSNTTKRANFGPCWRRPPVTNSGWSSANSAGNVSIHGPAGCDLEPSHSRDHPRRLPDGHLGGASLLWHWITRHTDSYNDPLRRSLWRAGLAPAGVLLILSLIALDLVAGAELSNGWKQVVRVDPRGRDPSTVAFFLSIARRMRTDPRGLSTSTKRKQISARRRMRPRAHHAVDAKPDHLEIHDYRNNFLMPLSERGCGQDRARGLLRCVELWECPDAAIGSYRPCQGPHRRLDRRSGSS